MPATRASGGAGCRATWQLVTHPHRIGSAGEGSVRQHFVEGDTQRMSRSAAGVDRAVHPAGLFQRHVGEASPADHLRRREAPGRIARQTGEEGTPQPRQPHAAACRVRQMMSADGLMSLWIRPRSCTRRSAPTKGSRCAEQPCGTSPSVQAGQASLERAILRCSSRSTQSIDVSSSTVAGAGLGRQIVARCRGRERCLLPQRGRMREPREARWRRDRGPRRRKLRAH